MKTQLAQDKAPFITLQGRRHKLLSMQPQEYKICHSSSPQPSSNSFPICTSNTVLLCRSFYSVNCKSATQLLFKSRLYIYFIFLKDPSLPFSDLRCVRSSASCSMKFTKYFLRLPTAFRMTVFIFNKWTRHQLRTLALSA